MTAEGDSPSALAVLTSNYLSRQNPSDSTPSATLNLLRYICDVRTLVSSPGLPHAPHIGAVLTGASVS